MRIPPAKFSLILLLLGLLVAAVFTLPSLANLEDVSDLFKQARYEEARQMLQSGEGGARPGEDLLWRSRLATSVSEAIEQLNTGLAEERLPEVVQQRIGLELAEIHFARADYRECMAVLAPLINNIDDDLAGEVYLLAGMTQRLTGNLQSAREMLASVRPGDPAFVQARYYLGDIGLQQGDYSLAQRYFESGFRDDDPAAHPGLEAGKWMALRAGGEFQAAEDVLAALQESAPSSLAMLEVSRILRDQDEELAARAATNTESESTVSQPVARTGRYCMQLGAFSDRALALEYHRRYKSQVSGLRIDEVRDDQGQFLYKVRAGSFVNPATARTQAAEIENKLGIDVIVSDLGDSTH